MVQALAVGIIYILLVDGVVAIVVDIPSAVVHAVAFESLFVLLGGILDNKSYVDLVLIPLLDFAVDDLHAVVLFLELNLLEAVIPIRLVEAKIRALP